MDDNANPLGTDGFEFIEFCAPDPTFIERHFAHLGFTAVAKHRSQSLVHYRQGDINFILNYEKKGYDHQFATQHGPSACGMGFRVRDAEFALNQAVSRGAKPVELSKNGDVYPLPAIEGIGGSVIYFVDKYKDETIYDLNYVPLDNSIPNSDKGLTYIDHVTHNVHRGNMEQWASFYREIFNFHQIRYFEIKGEMTGLLSRAMASPDGKIRIPINESIDDDSQIEEFIREFHGEGIQHIALGTDNIYDSVEKLSKSEIKFLSVPDTYYDGILERVPWHDEDTSRLQENRILIDGGKTPQDGLLLQIFTQNMLGPAFFEVIQRKGDEGFGEGNFQALFEAMERDQIRRGVLQAKPKDNS